MVGGRAPDPPLRLPLPPLLPTAPGARGLARDAAQAREAEALGKLALIADALERAGGNCSEAARQLGIARAQLYLKMEEYGIGGKGERAGK
jgi:DNA-binding NtrC family response regulator